MVPMSTSSPSSTTTTTSTAELKKPTSWTRNNHSTSTVSTSCSSLESCIADQPKRVRFDNSESPNTIEYLSRSSMTKEERLNAFYTKDDFRRMLSSLERWAQRGEKCIGLEQYTREGKGHYDSNLKVGKFVVIMAQKIQRRKRLEGEESTTRSLIGDDIAAAYAKIAVKCQESATERGRLLRMELTPPPPPRSTSPLGFLVKRLSSRSISAGSAPVNPPPKFPSKPKNTKRSRSWRR